MKTANNYIAHSKHRDRILGVSAASVIPSSPDAQAIFELNRPYEQNIKLGWTSVTGNLLNGSRLSKGFDVTPLMTGSNNDLAQTTNNLQPYYSKIAPAEKGCILNPNTGANYLTHPTISFAAGDSWTVEMLVHNFGNSGQHILFSGTASYQTFTSNSVLTFQSPDLDFLRSSSRTIM
jgi:hypothetical protein